MLIRSVTITLAANLYILIPEKMKNTHIIFVFSFLLISCEKKEGYQNSSLFTFQDFGESISLIAEPLEFDAPIMLPGKILLVDSILLVNNLNTEYVLYKYNIYSKKKIGECIAFGSGPNELLTMKEIQRFDSCIYISDNQKRKVFEYSIDELVYNSNPTPQKTITIADATNSLQRIPDGYVCTTMNPFNKRLSFYNSLGELINTMGEYPSFGKELSNIEKVESFNTQIRINPSSQYIYLFYMRTDLIEIYNFKGELIKRMHGPNQFFPRVKEVNLKDGLSKVIPIHGQAKDAYYLPLIVNDEIYVLYSGALRDRTTAPTTRILVFDKEGTPLRNYKLSESIINFCIDFKTGDIYAISNEPEYHMIKFKNIKSKNNE